MTFVRKLSRGQWPDMTLGQFDEWLGQFAYLGNNYGFTTVGGVQPGREEIGRDFAGFVESTFKSNSIVFACMLVRQMIFSEARFQYRRFENGRPGGLFGDKSLEILENPWPNGTTGDLLSRMIQDADLAGNAFIARRPGGQLRRLRPDWVSILLGSYETGTEEDFLNGDIDTEIIGYLYHPGGVTSAKNAIALLPEDVAHFAPIPDPTAQFRGMSWLNPIVNEILGDKAAMSHKQKFFENGGALQAIVSLQTDDPQDFKEYVEEFQKQHTGVKDAYKTAFIGAGADAKVIGTDLKQLDFQVVIQGGETRIAAAAGTHPIIVGLESGLSGSSLNAGNFTAARRRLADGTLRPLWRAAAGALQTIIDAPPRAQLWYDDRDIKFLQDDEKDAADRRQSDIVGMRQAVEAGWTPDSVREAWAADDMNLLVHSGLISVQLQSPGAPKDPAGTDDETPDNSTPARNGHHADAPTRLALTP